ncbi:uncharacterized protein LOC110689399 [Chenopodium quinoa]|uniref:uncharacterized protein LOC110689399 n=1 Tax=Chenopodium quinoa TaxID=63459 RepID=UPI000B7791FB|nr:uncharacterized protein LOC110689399 [Chenopodium quinoa]
MALVQRYGKPDLFITITCNTNWPEIKSELAPGEVAQDRPDLVARIFHAKLLALKKETMDNMIFGEVAALIYETTTNDEGYPTYRRRNTGEQLKVRGAMLDNRWVIPYNPYLSVLFDCHVNVEVFSTIKAVKYLYKYVYKGHDKISYNVMPANGDAVDEIQQYQSGRWVSPCEAVWRLFAFDLFEMHPLVILLQVHLPNQQTLHLHSHERLNAVVGN